jgi:hypothetical protein
VHDRLRALALGFAHRLGEQVGAVVAVGDDADLHRGIIEACRATINPRVLIGPSKLFVVRVLRAC